MLVVSRNWLTLVISIKVFLTVGYIRGEHFLFGVWNDSFLIPQTYLTNGFGTPYSAKFLKLGVGVENTGYVTLCGGD